MDSAEQIRARGLNVWACAVGAMLVGCAAEVAARPAPAVHAGPEASAGDARAEVLDAAVPDCTVKSAPRTWVPFAPGQTLDDFEQTALAARRLLGYVKAELCVLAPELDPSGALHEALRAGTTEIVSVEFSSVELTSAIVRFRPVGSDAGADDGSASGLSFALEVTLVGEAWQVRLIENR